MMNLVKMGVLALLLGGLIGAEQVFAQGSISIPRGPTNNRPAVPGFGGGGFGYGGHGYGGYGYGGYGGGFRNPWNPYSPYSPFNPVSPYSPYNPISPISPYYNPYNAGIYAATYAYNPLYNPGLLSRNPAVQFQAWNYANLSATNVYSYSNYYASALQNQQAMANMYQAQLYQQAAQQQYVNATNYSTQLVYLATIQAQQLKDNPYAQPQQKPTGPPPQQQPPSSYKYNSGFTGATSTSNSDSFLNNAGVAPSYGERPRSQGFSVPYAPPQISYTENQMRIQADVLLRVQKVASPGEIVSGSAQNWLLKDISKYIGLQSAMPPIALDEETLRELNVTKNGGNLGAIRIDGKVTWPVALGSYVLQPPETRKFEETVTRAVEAASKGKVDGDSMISMGKQIDDFRSKLVKKVNDIPTNDYIAAKRFLNDLDDARLALSQKNEWATNMDYQKFIAKGKSVQELAKFMIEKGITFAPATGTDEGSYKALYAALVAYDLQLNAQYAPQIAKE